MSEKVVEDKAKTLKKLSDILRGIQHPEKSQDLISARAVRSVNIPDSEPNKLQLSLDIGNDSKQKTIIEENIKRVIKNSEISNFKVEIKFVDALNNQPNHAHVQPPPNQNTSSKKDLSRVKYIVAIASGKGGVGKSTVAVNLGSALVSQGFKVGLLDADIYGPSLGKLVGSKGKVDLKVKENRIQPMDKYGMKIVSFSFLINEAQAVVWRGPMLGKALEQFLYDVEWGELDYLLIDLPPGTGDIQLSLGQLVEVHGVIMVTTPQDVAVQDAMRAAEMFDQVKIPIIGIIENMGQFICPHCHKSSEIFSKGGGEQLSVKTESDMLAHIPLSVELMNASEKGIPVFSKQVKKLKGAAEALKPVQEAFHQAAMSLNSILTEAYQAEANQDN